MKKKMCPNYQTGAMTCYKGKWGYDIGCDKLNTNPDCSLRTRKNDIINFQSAIKEAIKTFEELLRRYGSH